MKDAGEDGLSLLGVFRGSDWALFPVRAGLVVFLWVSVDEVLLFPSDSREEFDSDLRLKGLSSVLKDIYIVKEECDTERSVIQDHDQWLKISNSLWVY